MRVNADLDALAITYGLPLFGGVAANFGPLSFRGDIFDIDLGPTIDLNQDFALDPTLMLDLAFSEPVLARFGLGETQTLSSWGGSLSEIPEFAILGEEVTVTPTYSVQANLTNQTNLGFDVTYSVDVLKGRISLSLISSGDHSVVDHDFPIPLGNVDVYDQTFALAGFNTVGGNPFKLITVSLTEGSGSNQSESSGIGSSPQPVPEPDILLLLAIGIIFFGLHARYRRA